MPNTDYTAVESNLIALGYTDDNNDKRRIKEAVLELFHTLDAQNLADREDWQAALDLFTSIANNLSTAEAPTSSHWEEFVLGVTRPGDVVRVRENAYSGAGEKHNRLVGVITAVRGGRVLVRYSGRNDGVGHSHHPDNLEVLKK